MNILFYKSPFLAQAASASPSIADWIQVVLVAVTAVGIIYTALQARAAFQSLKVAAEQNRITAEQTRFALEQTNIARKQLEEDLKRFRHEQGIGVLREWAQFSAGLDPALIHLARQFDEAQALLLVERSPIKLKEDQKEIFCALLDLKPSPLGEVILNVKQVIEIRDEAFKFLNMLEWCLSVWAEVAREEFIFKQFAGIADASTGDMDLAVIRRASGDAAFWPSIVEFENEFKRRSRIAAPPNPPGQQPPLQHKMQRQFRQLQRVIHP